MERVLGRKALRTRHGCIDMAAVLAAAIATTCLVPAAQSQSAPTVHSVEPEHVIAAMGSGALEEVVVTARRRNEDIQKVPIAITVVSQQAIRESNVQSLGDLQYLAPSLSSGSRESRDSLSLGIRGQGQSITAQPGVLVYVNEVPIPVNSQGETSGGPGLLFDLEHVEILKGPQGTLFGRNAVGGALLLRTAEPKSEFGGSVQLGYGNYNNRELDGAINLPLISDRLLVRLAVNGQKRDGFTHILATPSHPGGVDTDARDTLSFRGTVEWRPTERFRNDAIFTFSQYDSNGSPYVLDALAPGGGTAGAIFPSFVPMLAQQQALGVRTVLPLDKDPVAKGTAQSLNNISVFTLNDNVTFRNIFGYTVAKQTFVRDVDTTMLPVLEPNSSPIEDVYQQYSEEAQVQGLSSDKRLTWILGGFYLDQPLPDHYTPVTEVVFGGRADRAARLSEKSTAAFAQGSYEIVPGLKFTAGLRQTWDERFKSQEGGSFGSVCVGAAQANCDVAVDTQAKSHALTWTVGLDYQVNPDTLAYITSRRGYRAGGYNTNPALPTFKPEFVTDVEVGTKSEWRVGSVAIRTNADLYYQDYSDIQVQQNIFLNNVFTAVTTNAATGKFWGVEFESLAQLTRDLQLAVSFDNLNFQVTNLGPGVDPIQLNGSKLADRPKWKYAVDARYHLPLAADLGDVSVQAKWHWQSETQINYTDTLGAPSNDFSSYGLLNLAAHWDRIAGKPYDLELYASNVTNRIYKISGATLLTNIGFSFVQYGEPRMYGLRVRYHFGSE